MNRPEERFAELSKALAKDPRVSQPVGKRGFGSSGLYASGKLFAFLSYKNQLIVKLSHERVNELVAKGEGIRWDPRRDGRNMKGWFVLKPSSRAEWLPLVKEAMEFVTSNEKGRTQ